MLGTGIINTAKNSYTSLIAAVSGLTRIKLAHRILVVIGLISDIVVSVVQSAATMNPATWVVETGVIFFNINSKMISNIATLEAGVGRIRALQITLAIWGYMFVIYFAVKFFAKTAEETFAGDNNPRITMYIWIAIFVVAPVQMVGALLTQGFTEGNIGFTKEVVPYSGVYEVFTHTSLWLEPVKQTVPQGLVYLGSEGNNTIVVGS